MSSRNNLYNSVQTTILYRLFDTTVQTILIPHDLLPFPELELFRAIKSRQCTTVYAHGLRELHLLRAFRSRKWTASYAHQSPDFIRLKSPNVLITSTHNTHYSTDSQERKSANLASVLPFKYIIFICTATSFWRRICTSAPFTLYFSSLFFSSFLAHIITCFIVESKDLE
jgi:hypothetical protein